MSSKSVAARAARESARKRIGKFSINSIYKKGPSAGYPECPGTHDNCPEQIEEHKNPPEECKKCPMFLESRYHEKGVDDARHRQIHELFASFRKGAEENTPAETIERVEKKEIKDECAEE